MRPEIAPKRLKDELHMLFDNIRVDLDRVEILSAAVCAFTQPVPDYEPRFRHMQHAIVEAKELS